MKERLTAAAVTVAALAIIAPADAKVTAGTYWSCKQKAHAHVHIGQPAAKHRREHRCKSRSVSASQPSAATPSASPRDDAPRIYDLTQQRWGFVQALAGIAGMRCEPGESCGGELEQAVTRAYDAVRAEGVTPAPVSILPTVHPFDDRGCIFEPGGCNWITTDRDRWRDEHTRVLGLGARVADAADAYILNPSPANLAELEAALAAWRA